MIELKLIYKYFLRRSVERVINRLSGRNQQPMEAIFIFYPLFCYFCGKFFHHHGQCILSYYFHQFFEKAKAQIHFFRATTGTEWLQTTGELLESYSPADGKLIGKIKMASRTDYEIIVSTAEKAFAEWRKVPAPNGRSGTADRRRTPEKQGVARGTRIYEMGKSLQEGLGEVQEMIDICDFSVGLSRQLYGLTMHSERPNHRMYEQWHPLGIVGVISAFNFPVAVWSWNAMLAMACGDVVVWKPSSKVMLCAVATHQVIAPVLKKNNVPKACSHLLAEARKKWVM
jgi:aldehyde dehydrogenase (NAD+)